MQSSTACCGVNQRPPSREGIPHKKIWQGNLGLLGWTGYYFLSPNYKPTLRHKMWHKACHRTSFVWLIICRPKLVTELEMARQGSLPTVAPVKPYTELALICRGKGYRGNTHTHTRVYTQTCTQAETRGTHGRTHIRTHERARAWVTLDRACDGWPL